VNETISRGALSLTISGLQFINWEGTGKGGGPPANFREEEFAVGRHHRPERVKGGKGKKGGEGQPEAVQGPRGVWGTGYYQAKRTETTSGERVLRCKEASKGGRGPGKPHAQTTGGSQGGRWLLSKYSVLHLNPQKRKNGQHLN